MVMTRSGLAIPASEMPNFICEVCGEGFYEQSVHVRHVARCVKRNRDKIERVAEMHRDRDPLEQATDHEALAFQRRKYAHLYP
jgi:hypothetical protein